MPTKRFVPKPDLLKVGHRTYAIKWLLDSEWKAHALDPDNRGESHHTTQTIYVRLDMEDDEAHKDMLQEVLLHETLHCVTNTSMVWNMWDNLRSDREEFSLVEEWIVGAQAPILLQV